MYDPTNPALNELFAMILLEITTFIWHLQCLVHYFQKFIIFDENFIFALILMYIKILLQNDYRLNCSRIN